MSQFLNQFLPRIYSCAQHPSLWSESLDQLGDHLGVKNVALQVYRRGESRLEQQWAVRDSASFSQRSLHDRLVNNANNPRLDLRFNSVVEEPVSIIRDQDIFPSDYPEYVAFQKRLRRLGLGKSMTLELRGEDRSICLIVHKASSARKDFSLTQERLMNSLAPHLRQAVELFEHTMRLQQQARVFSETADNLATGVMLFDREYNLRWLNRYALQAIGRSPFIVLADQRLEFQSAEENGEFLHYLSLSAQGKLPGGRGIVTLGADTLHSVQMLVTEPISPVLPEVMTTMEQEMIPVYLSEGSGTFSLSSQEVASLFNLTPTEARLATALANGLSVSEYASQKGVSVGTARIQLKSIFLKTHTSGQADLIKRLCTSVSAKTGLLS